jgi:2-oxoglutarate dehydrogenase E2 component (dihydrolipoamide succinyltransferase)
MKVDVLMPKLGESITEGTIVKWWKKPGDYVKKDETLLEISTDKVDSEIPSPYEGVLVEVKANENDVVQVDSVIAVIDTEASGESAQSEPAAQSETKQAPAPQQPAEAPAAPAQAPQSNGKEAAAAAVVDVEMPKLGESITEGNIVKWWKKVGDTVKKDETLLEISTDKVDSEIPSPYEGVITEILAEEGATVQVGSVIARIKTGDAAAETATGASQAAAQSSTPAATTNGAKSGEAAEAVTSHAAPSGVSARGKGGKFYSPLVRSIARKEGISKEELESIPGTGLDGRVTKKDILNYLQSGRVVQRPAASQPAAATTKTAAPAAAPAASAPSQPAPSLEEVQKRYEGKRVEVIPMDNIRKKIAEHMVHSKHTSPHVYGVAEVDFTNAMALVTKHRDAWMQKEKMKLTVNPMILFAVAKALNDFPDINASVEGTNIVKYNYVNIGMAVATDRGLIVPVLKNADELNFRGVARNAYELAMKTRDRKLKPDDVVGATFTVTNYGVFGNVIGFPIINQPNVAILGVGAIKKRPVVLETEHGDIIAIRQIGYLTLSYDHRIVDGELGDRFLQRVRHYLENFSEDWL